VGTHSAASASARTSDSDRHYAAPKLKDWWPGTSALDRGGELQEGGGRARNHSTTCRPGVVVLTMGAVGAAGVVTLQALRRPAIEALRDL
jgi:hypothetical protein